MDASAWDERYRDERQWSVEPNRFVEEACRGLPPGRALDLAAGEGRNAIWLASQGWDVTAVDFSAVAVERGRGAAQTANVDVEWVIDDVATWRSPPETYDLVVIAYLHLPPDERRLVLEGARHSLAPGGTLLIVGHDRDNLEHGYGGPQVPEILLTSGELVAELAGLEIQRAGHVTRDVPTEEGIRTAIDALVVARRPAA